MIELGPTTRILALYPHRRGLSYALLCESRSLEAFGRRWIPSDKHRRSLAAAKDLLRRFSPERVVMEDPNDPDLNRCRRIQRFLRSLHARIERRGPHLAPVTRAQRTLVFKRREVSNKDELATLLAHLYPVLADRLPPKREVWMAESESMGVFDALALALTVLGVPETPMDDELTWLGPDAT